MSLHSPTKGVNLYNQLHRAGLKVASLWDDGMHFSDDLPIHGKGAVFRKAILQEAKARKCKRKECRKHGCDCEE